MYELFHLIAESDSAAARVEVLELGLKERVDFRNLFYPEAQDAFRERGGSRTPALWDGTRLHQGLEAVLDALREIG